MEDQKETIEESNELFEHFKVVADPGQSLLRVDKFLFHHIPQISRNKIQNAAKAGNILVNEKPVKSNYKVKPHDEVSIVHAHPPREVEIIPQEVELNIVYEDNDVMVVNKQAGLVVHPGHGNYEGTLLNGLAYYFEKSGQTAVDNKYGYLAHRIDKNTTGLLVIAKNETAQAKLAKQFFDHTVDRTYVALVWGDIELEEGTIEGHIGRSLKDRRVMTVFPDGEYGKEATTHYKVSKRYGYTTLVECKLETGRTHQIRAHLKYLGHPLFNDERYGGNQILKGTTFTKYKQFIHNCFKLIQRQSLHAKSIGFTHPVTGERLFFESELPEDFKLVLEKWDGYVQYRQFEDNHDSAD